MAATSVTNATSVKDAVKTMPSVPKSSPVGKNGRLSVSGNKIVNKNGKEFVIKGVSTHGLSWFPEYVNKAGFKTLRDDFGVNTIRLAMYTSEYNGYCTGDSQNRKKLKKLVDEGIQYATELGMYVIVDWHILNDGNPQTYQKESVAFFKGMAGKYKNYTNVIYEICNEPNGSEGNLENIKSYSKAVIKAIRAIDKKAIIIVGSPTWSQDVDKTASNPITGYKNIAYAFHFYADTHRDELRTKFTNAVESGLPVVVTEFGITSASGNGTVNKSEGNKWIALLDQYSIGRVCWNLSNKDEASALLKSSCTRTSKWSATDLSEQGKWLLKVYTGKTKTSNANSKSATGTKDTKKIKGTVALTSSWEQDGEYYYLYTVDVKGKGSKRTAKWTAALTFSGKPTFEQGWCGDYSTKDKKITIKSVSYNGKLKKGETTQVGFIIHSKKAITLKKITMKCS